MVDKLVPNDPRVQSKTATIRGKTYHYLLAEPSTSPPVDTVILLHGFPDLSFGWRYQVPALLALNLRVIIPDNLGYGGTDAPVEVEPYSLKSLSDDIAGLIAHVCGTGVSVIVGGHDWGAGLAWRLALWHPKIVRAIFNACVPYFPPREQYTPLKVIIGAGKLQNFKYQLQFQGTDVEKEIQGKEKIRQFLNAIFGGKAPDGSYGFTTDDGVVFDKIAELQQTPLVTPEELDYYTEQIARNGIHGPLNWYRTGEISYKEEIALLKKGLPGLRFNIPALFVAASKDGALPPAMAQGMDEHFDRLTKVEIDASHWVLWQGAEEFNQHLTNWLQQAVLKPGKPAL
ncbi:hypothetical protein jhhlp_001243 [Lomentospora prolificans]|uniref:AB hydrolase-1 domain-containing protein n=1 Tax=Lomentospora prolificans TaxID=41688 RepID=A0A2N3NHQ1_9PEZI|nr:hypothetical protein jhhlp_001243 [Lomentospora prolificans]